MTEDARLLVHGFQAGYSLGRLRFEHLCIFPDPDKISPEDPHISEHFLDMVSLLRISTSHLLRSMPEGAGAAYRDALDPLLAAMTTQWVAFCTSVRLSTIRKAIERKLEKIKNSPMTPPPDKRVQGQLVSLFKNMPSEPSGQRISHNSATKRLAVARRFEARSPVFSLIVALDNLLAKMLQECSSIIEDACWLGCGVGGAYRKLLDERRSPSKNFEDLKTAVCGVLRQERRQSAQRLFRGLTASSSEVAGHPKLYNLFRPLAGLYRLVVDEFTEMAESADPADAPPNPRLAGAFVVEVDGSREDVLCDNVRLDLDGDSFRLVYFICDAPGLDHAPSAVRCDGKIQNLPKALKRFQDACEKIGVNPNRMLTHVSRKAYRWEPKPKRKNPHRPKLRKFDVPAPRE